MPAEVVTEIKIRAEGDTATDATAQAERAVIDSGYEPYIVTVSRTFRKDAKAWECVIVGKEPKK